MDYRYKQLEQDLSALSNVFSDLGSRLTEAAKDVGSTGLLPPEKLIEQILTARTNFENVRTAVHGLAGAMLVNPLPTVDEVASIRAIGALLKTAAAAEEGRLSAQGELEKVTSLLAKVLAITHRESSVFQPLQECHAKITELQNNISKVAWPERHPEADAIIALRHPSTALLNFVENLDTLEDDKWMALETLITEAYGKPLFVAASRGKLTVPQSAAAPAAPAKPAPAAEKPVIEKPVVERPAPEKPVAEKHVEKKVAHEKPVEKTVAHPTPAAPVEKKPAPVAAEPAPAAPAQPAAPVAPAALTQPTAPAAMPQAPAPVAPITSTTVPTRPPAPITVAPASPAPPAVPVAPAAASSLSALANATEPSVKPTAPSESTDKGRKEPRLAAPPAPQQPARPEPTAEEQEQNANESSHGAMAADGQRPQRWGFWRGNR